MFTYFVSFAILAVVASTASASQPRELHHRIYENATLDHSILKDAICDFSSNTCVGLDSIRYEKASFFDSGEHTTKASISRYWLGQSVKSTFSISESTRDELVNKLMSSGICLTHRKLPTSKGKMQIGSSLLKKTVKVPAYCSLTLHQAKTTIVQFTIKQASYGRKMVKSVVGKMELLSAQFKANWSSSDCKAASSLEQLNCPKYVAQAN